MPELLELAHLVDQHRVPEMQIRCRGVEARLDAQRHAARQFALELGGQQHFVRAARQLDQLWGEAPRVRILNHSGERYSKDAGTVAKDRAWRR